MNDYTSKNLDREVLAWYKKISLSDLEKALNALCQEYDSSKENASYRIASRLNALANLDLGLWITWKTSSGAPPAGGYVYSFMENDSACYAKIPYVDGIIRVPYSEITGVDLQLPNYQEKAEDVTKEIIAQVLDIQYKTALAMNSILVANLDLGSDEFEKGNRRVYSNLLEIADLIEQARDKLKENHD